MAERWATFDCYGTLVDWNGGIERELARLFGAGGAPRLLAHYHELEPEVQAEALRPYREVLAVTLERLAADVGLTPAAGERDALARSLPDWDPFPEARAALQELRRRGWRLAILSNTDPDLLAESCERIGVPFDLAVTAEDAGSYKPAHGHWRAFFDRTGAEPTRHVHVAASAFHDIVPAGELGLASVWINRLDERSDATPTRELPDLSALPDTLDELVAA